MGRWVHETRRRGGSCVQTWKHVKNEQTSKATRRQIYLFRGKNCRGFFFSPLLFRSSFVFREKCTFSMPCCLIGSPQISTKEQETEDSFSPHVCPFSLWLNIENKGFFSSLSAASRLRHFSHFLSPPLFHVQGFEQREGGGGSAAADRAQFPAFAAVSFASAVFLLLTSFA